MSSLSFSSITYQGASWQVTGLSSSWDDNNYVKMYIVTSPVTNGQTSSPSGTLYSTIFPPTSGTNSFTPITSFTGLSASTFYYLYAVVQTPNGGGAGIPAWFNAGETGFTTSALPVPNAPTGVTVTSLTKTGFDVSWTPPSSGSTPSYYEVWLEGSGSHPTTTGTSYHISASLTPGTNYWVDIIPHNSSGQGSAGVAGPFSPPYDTPGAITSLTITNFNGYCHLVWNSSTNATFYRVTWSPGSGSVDKTAPTLTTDVMGLTNGTTYTFTVTPYNVSTPGTGKSGTGTPTSRPSNFVWTNSKAGNDPFVLGHAEWSNFKNFINGMREYVHGSPDNYTWTTTPVAGDAFTAAMYYEVRAAAVHIPYVATNLPSRTLSAVISSGGNIYGYYFTDLSETLNDIV